MKKGTISTELFETKQTFCQNCHFVNQFQKCSFCFANDLTETAPELAPLPGPLFFQTHAVFGKILP